jgi:hypothetical protein
MPTFKKAAGMRAEIQVRSGAQHIWASASHILQYKQERDVPPPVRRAISRVAALLETVDLEFERVLDERAVYGSQKKSETATDELNVDLLAKVLDEELPSENMETEERYAELLPELLFFSINTPKKLRELIAKHRQLRRMKPNQLIAAEMRCQWGTSLLAAQLSVQIKVSITRTQG